MIVRSVAAGWEIIFQSAHALLAGQIASQLKQLPQVDHWAETLAAILDHDDHKEAFGQNLYLTDVGAPRDFTQFRQTARERFLEVKRRVEHGYRKHRWIGLLAARHAEELYREVKVSKSLSELLQQERDRRKPLLHELKTTVEALEMAYTVMQWCDRLSLIFCQGEVPAMHRRLEIAPLAGHRSYELWEAEDQRVVIDPWPFQTDVVTIHVEVRTVPQLSFRTDRELEHCLLDSPVEDRRWTLIKKPQRESLPDRRMNLSRPHPHA